MSEDRPAPWNPIAIVLGCLIAAGIWALCAILFGWAVGAGEAAVRHWLG